MSDDNRITNLAQVEALVNEHARTIAHKHGVREDIWHVSLVRKMSRGDMTIVPGTKVIIQLLWPQVQPIVNSKLDSAFRLMTKRNDIWTPLAIATHAFFAKEGREGKRWVRQKLGKDMADSLGSLIPKYRLEVITTKVIEVKDRVTGASVMMSTQKVGDHRFAPSVMWSQLSQIVFEKPELPDVDIDSDGEIEGENTI